MSLVVYSTLTRRKEPFRTVVPGKVGIYLCGPTVYKPSHIGHAVGPIIFDAIKRYLTFRGYDVTWVVNITDVDDKLILEAGRQNIGVYTLAERVTADYLKAMEALYVEGIDIMPKASEHIADIIRIIQRLIEKNYAYPVGGDVYFDVTRDTDYGKLSNRKLEDQEGQRELQSGDKRHPGDFALWKAAKPEEPDEVKFDSPWGKGRPGWHIECSAMAQRYLGETLDIHGGGMDLIFPHHENELAQSESCNDKPFANFWLHNGLTRFNTKKVAKSDADPEMQAALVRMTLHNLLALYPGELIRFFVLSTHYRRPIEYSEAELESKRKGLDAFYRLFERVQRISGVSPYHAAGLEAAVSDETLAAACAQHFTAFTDGMDDDFNTAAGIAALFDWAGAINRYVEQNKLEASVSDVQKRDTLHATGRLIAAARLIGLFLEPQTAGSAGNDGVAEKAMQVLIAVRQHLRKKKDYETADLIRNLLTERKITLEDRPDGTVWRAES